MQMGIWDSLVNLVLLVFWLRLWTRSDDRNLVFNRYLAPFDRAASLVTDFLRPVCLGAPPQVAAAAVLVFVIVLRGLAVPDRASWLLTLGFDRVADTGHVGTRIAFSALSFGVFLFKLWSLAVLYAGSRARAFREQPVTALAHLSRPLSLLHVEWRPLALFGFGILVAALLDVGGHAIPRSTLAVLPVGLHWQADAPVVTALKLALLALAAWVQVLPVIQSILFLLILGSWISMFTGSDGLIVLCHDWITLLLGPLRRFPLRLGLFDLTPIVFAFALGYISNGLMQLLYSALRTLS